jgi:HPr kinase/phosphorylase
MADDASIHASAVLIGAKAILIRGASGSGKSQLAFDLLQAPGVPFSRLVGDDRVHVEAIASRLLVRPAPALAGLIEVRGLGIRRLPYEPLAIVGLIVDLAAADATRLPPREAEIAVICGISLPRLAVAGGQGALPLILAWLGTAAAIAGTAN